MVCRSASTPPPAVQPFLPSTLAAPDQLSGSDPVRSRVGPAGLLPSGCVGAMSCSLDSLHAVGSHPGSDPGQPPAGTEGAVESAGGWLPVQFAALTAGVGGGIRMRMIMGGTGP